MPTRNIHIGAHLKSWISCSMFCGDWGTFCGQHIMLSRQRRESYQESCLFSFPRPAECWQAVLTNKYRKNFHKFTPFKYFNKQFVKIPPKSLQIKLHHQLREFSNLKLIKFLWSSFCIKHLDLCSWLSTSQWD